MPNFSNRSLLGIAMLIAGYLSFTMGDTLIKLLSARYPILQIVCLVGISLALSIIGLGIYRGRMNVFKTKRPGLLLARGILNTGHSALVYYSFAHMPIVNVYAFLFASPLFLTLFSIIFLGEEVGWRRWSAILVGFAGILIMLRPGGMALSGALLIVAITPITSSLGMLLIRFASRTESTLTIAVFSASMNILLAGTLMLPHFVVPTLVDGLMFAAAGGINAVALILVIKGFSYTGTPLGAPFQYTQLLWGALVGWFFWHNRFDFWMYVGAAVVGSSGLFTFYRELVRHRHALHSADLSVANEIIGARKV